MASLQRGQRIFFQRHSTFATLSQICFVLLLLLPHGTQSFLTSQLQSGTFIRWHSNNNDCATTLPHMAAQNNGESSIAYLVEPISRAANEQVFAEIAEMCIDVFFKESLGAKPKDKIAPWKEIQISSLKTLQTADLQRRRKIYPKANEMFLAYKVEPVPSSSTAAEDKPLILDLESVQNLSPVEGMEYVRGEIIGFVEITQKPYGLGKGKGRIVYDDEPLPPLRPILTNLAVKKAVRKYGVGSKLLDACEEYVQKTWEMGEIVLEVEDYNTGALDFYGNREFDTLYDDPASRRYDVGGLVLRKVRCTRKVMRKVFEGFEDSESESTSEEGDDEIVTIDADFFNRKKSSAVGG